MTHRTYYDFNNLRWSDMVPGDTFAFDSSKYDPDQNVWWLGGSNGPPCYSIKPGSIALVVSRRAAKLTPNCNYFMFLLPGPVLTSELEFVV